MRTAAIGVLLVLGLAAAVRLPGLGNGLPQMQDPDSLFVIQASRFEQMDSVAEPEDVIVPDLYPHFLGRVLAGLPGKLEVRAPRGAPLEEHLRAAAKRDVQGRWICALFSLLAVPAVYLLARPHLPVGWAVLAALFAATSLLGTVLSHQARPHAPLFAFTAWSLVAAQRLVRAPTTENLTLAAVASGLALATLHSGAAAVLPVAVACLIVLVRRGPRSFLPLALVGLGPLFALYFSYPFFFDGELWAGRPWPENTFDGTGFLRTARTLWAYEPTLVVLAVLAFLPAAILRRSPIEGERDVRLERFVLASFALPYLIAIGLYYSTWHRFSLPLIPVLSVVAAIGARRVALSVAAFLPAWRSPVLVSVAVLAALFPTLTALRFGWAWSRPHVTTVAARWIEENLDPAETRLVLSYGLNLPLLQTPLSTRHTSKLWRTPWQRYQLRFEAETGAWPDGTAWEMGNTWVRPNRRQDIARISVRDVRHRLKDQDATHVLVVVPGPTDIRSEADETLMALEAAGAKLVQRFVSYESETMSGTVGGVDQLEYEPIAVAWRARGMGPLLELYELPVRKAKNR